MKRFLLSMIVFWVIVPQTFSQAAEEPKGLKVFVSVDMEGITGVVNWEDVRREGKDYDYFRKIMTKEANAAIAGAIAAGAKEILVRDSHGSARNIFPAPKSCI